MLYPSVSDYWNSLHQSRAIATYVKDVGELDETQYEEMWRAAEDYNRSLAETGILWKLTEEEKLEYENILDVTGTGIMGYVEIPKIRISLPIYHGTDETVLQIAIGHLEGSSLPVGGAGSHCIISGHRGLPSAKLFTDLDELEVGDRFQMHILNDTLAYEVDQIRIVEPQDLNDLSIVKGKDYCTLVTCTPYGVNTHRLLIRGIRTEYVEPEEKAEETPIQQIAKVDPVKIMIIGLVAMVIMIIIVYIVIRRKNRKTEESSRKDE